MHILKIIHGFPPKYNAGSEVYSQSVVNELAKKHQVTVFTREENQYKPDFIFSTKTKGNINFVLVNMAQAKDAYNHEKVNLQFANLLAQIKPDIAHIGHLNHLSTGIVKVLSQAKIPIIFTLHDFWLLCPRGQFLQRNFDGKKIHQLCDSQQDNKCATSCYKMYFSGTEGENYYTNWVKNRMEISREITKKVNLFIAPSKYLMKRYINDFNIPKKKISYLDYGFPTHYLKPVKQKTNGIFTFGYIGTHIPAKGLNLLIEAFKKIESQAKLLIFGRQNGQSTLVLKGMAKKSKNSIEFCGEYINENLADTVFSKIDAIVVPSIWGENSPLVIHESQACKIPVITANFGGMKEYVNHNINGLLFEHRNYESLYEQMKYALENPEKMKQLGQKGYLFSENGEVPGIAEHCQLLIENYKRLIAYKSSNFVKFH